MKPIALCALLLAACASQRQPPVLVEHGAIVCKGRPLERRVTPWGEALVCPDGGELLCDRERCYVMRAAKQQAATPWRLLRRGQPGPLAPNREVIVHGYDAPQQRGEEG